MGFECGEIRPLRHASLPAFAYVFTNCSIYSHFLLCRQAGIKQLILGGFLERCGGVAEFDDETRDLAMPGRVIRRTQQR